MEQVDLLVTGIGELATPVDPGRPLRRGELAQLRIIPSAAIAVRDTVIVDVGPQSEVCSRFASEKTEDMQGRLVTPGLVDPHTHACFVGTREDEFEWRLGGVSYTEIAQRGGGILSTVRRVREASDHALRSALSDHLHTMFQFGTTTAEVKSGYGLNRNDELRMLRTIIEVGTEGDPETVPTFLGAHEVPLEHRSDRRAWIEHLVHDLIPEVARGGFAEYCDVFCETGVFSVEEAKEILLAGLRHGLKSRIHAEEFTAIGGARLAAWLSAVSADHLMALPADDIPVLAKTHTIATLLPATTFFLGQKPAPARALIEGGVPVALGTDFNPGSSMTESMQMVMTLACLLYKMTPAEALSAATLNAAYALGRGARIGSVEKGKQADFVAWDAEHYRQLPYHFGVNQVCYLVKSGHYYVRQ